MLAAVPIEVVATIASNLNLSEEIPHVSIGRAYQLLEIAADGQETLKTSKGYVEGITRNAFALGYHAGQVEVEIRLPKDITTLEANGTPLDVPFEAVLANLMGKLKKVDRLPRFKWWLMAVMHITNEKASSLIEAWREKGVPPGIYQQARKTFNAWWKERERKRLSEQGKAPKKGKQGRVKSKTDKREGARPPVEKFKKALGVS